ncbi:ABC transporter ATP-binding protein [Picrophilus oshimae]|uniref:ATP-binding cassette, subfamily B n=1 Tax=Picrophilus torridus (strain ATCC 700027 / DSM 9790 / JCM 10055 / NBRC 100828 / KAW 2/3) TaxID=1122961 RepID=A0A8G2L891_PICTO|nr:ABC transporter ATP-binding protein [Picrophilus oshimae]SMD31185.1 ATP-binding cassette, subfamily B [Picrophilus oshimae DSM 9789]
MNNYSIRRVLRDLMIYKKRLYLVSMAIIGSSIVAMIGPYIIGLAVDAITHRDLSLILDFGIIYIIIYIINYAFERLRTYNMTYISQGFIMNLRNREFERLQYVPLGYYTYRKAGEIISRITNDGEAMSDFLTFQMPQVLAGVIGIIFSMAIMLYLDWNLALYSFIVIPLLLITVFSISGKIRNYYNETRIKIARLTGFASESINGISSIKEFGSEQRFIDEFSVKNYENYLANIRANRLGSIFSSLVDIIQALGIIIVIGVGATQVINHTIQIGLLVSFIVYVQSFFNPLAQLSQFYNSYQSSKVAIKRIYSIIDEEQDDNKYKYKIEDFGSEIKFENVSFSYGSKLALKNINFSLKRGEKLAIIGKTGAGKSTLINLLLRFYRPESGEIKIDNININDVDIYSYRSLFGVILQEPLLFNGSIMDNIKFNGNYTDDDVINLIKRFNLEGIFSEKDLYENVGENGHGLSQGQRQAVSILRAMIRNPEIVIMDEATSQLDPETEEIIQNAIRSVNKTFIVIAHHLSTILDSDQAILLENGEIKSTGTPEHVLKINGLLD